MALFGKDLFHHAKPSVNRASCSILPSLYFRLLDGLKMATLKSYKEKMAAGTTITNHENFWIKILQNVNSMFIRID